MNKKALIEAALFVSDKALSLETLSNLTGIGPEEIKQFIGEIQQEYVADDKGFDLLETPEGYEFRVKAEYRNTVAGLAPFADLSSGMMRTLGIVALKQPIKQSIIVHYQGNKAYVYISQLENKGLVKAVKDGRTKIVTTTPGFEDYFGKSSEDMKRMLDESLKKGNPDS